MIRQASVRFALVRSGGVWLSAVLAVEGLLGASGCGRTRADGPSSPPGGAGYGGSTSGEFSAAAGNAGTLAEQGGASGVSDATGDSGAGTGLLAPALARCRARPNTNANPRIDCIELAELGTYPFIVIEPQRRDACPSALEFRRDVNPDGGESRGVFCGPFTPDELGVVTNAACCYVTVDVVVLDP